MLRYSAHALILSILALIFLGLVMLLSTGEFGSYSAVDPLREVKRQTVWLFIGLIGLLFAARVDYEVWQKTTWLLYGGTMVLLLLCFVPTIGESRNGASRWISGTHYGASFLRMQPSELGKLAAIIGMAAWYHKYQGLAETFKQGFFFPLLVAGGLVVPIVLEVDIGTSALILVVCGIMMFLAGVQFRWLIGSAVAGLAGLAGLVYMIPNRLERFLAFLNPEEHKLDAFYQQWQGLIALGSGGVHGLGIGKSVRKEFLPHAPTDFIFPIIGEELGLVATLLVILAFVVILVSGFLIALHAPTRFGMLLGAGLVSLIVIQAIINMGVTTGCLPNKGIPLPMISYGGSNLVVILVSIGILLNLYRQGWRMENRKSVKVKKKRMTASI